MGLFYGLVAFAVDADPLSSTILVFVPDFPSGVRLLLDGLSWCFSKLTEGLLHIAIQSLLSSLHLHASQHFTSHHSILPPLTTSTPLLPPHLLTHFTNLSKEINEEEEALLKKEGMTRRDLKKVREGRLGKMGRGGRKGVWRNAEKGFDASGLVALGESKRSPLSCDEIREGGIRYQRVFPNPIQHVFLLQTVS